MRRTDNALVQRPSFSLRVPSQHWMPNWPYHVNLILSPKVPSNTSSNVPESHTHGAIVAGMGRQGNDETGAAARHRVIVLAGPVAFGHIGAM